MDGEISSHLRKCFALSADSQLLQICSSYDEMLKQLAIINEAERKLDNFLSGEITEDDYLSFIEQFTPIDQYIENTDANLASWLGEGWDS